MNTHFPSLSTHSHKPRRTVALAICALIATLLFSGEGGWIAQAAPPVQENPPSRLPYDAHFDLSRLADAVVPEETAPVMMGPEYTNWSKLVFQSGRNQHDWEIYTARGDGNNQTNISNRGSEDMHPRLNRGGTRVVFSSNRDGNYEIYTMNGDGSGLARLTNEGTDDVYPAWSPDGTKIVFQSYRANQPEIYVMNADGSNPVRLTQHPDYDGQPAWSPDGSKIAFVRRESGLYRIWVMNASGGNQRQLSNQAYSDNPAWSPNSAQIAYDADGNGDSWQEIWLMNADGSNQQQVYDPPEANTDAWVGSFAPDGGYVAFTRISFVQQGGSWYWTTAYLDAWENRYPWGDTIRLSRNGLDWNVDWKSIDYLPPSSSVQALPAQSPAQFTVRWSGSDQGPAGIASYDVQVKDGASGAWTDWQTSTTGVVNGYAGIGGHTYFFRARARDNAGNVEAWPASHDTSTTVETLPPITAVGSLPAYIRGQQVSVAWAGEDPGGSGIRSFDVQYQDASGGDWVNWRTATTNTAATFTRTTGFTYRFRSRGLDLAQNLEAWPPGAGDTQTTFYRWAASGQVKDTGGAPVRGASVNSLPTAISPVTSDGGGQFAMHVGADSTNYALDIAKAGYGSLPTTTFGNQEDIRLDPVLPPPDNIVRNWGFETGSLQPDWQTGGPGAAVATTSLRHSGSYAVLLGGVEPQFSAPVGLSSSGQVSDGRPAMVVDGSGNLTIAWSSGASGQHDIFTASRPANGAWSAPAALVTFGDSTNPLLFLGSEGVVYMFWMEDEGATSYTAHASRTPGGPWSAPQQLQIGSLWQTSQVAVDAGGNLHVVWVDEASIYYSWKDALGNWQSPQPIGSTPGYMGYYPSIALDQLGQIHVAWSDYTNPLYVCRSSAGAWSTQITLAPRFYTADVSLAVVADGTAYVVWVNPYGVGLLEEAHGSCQGAWSNARTIAPIHTMPRNPEPQLVADETAILHLLWADQDSWPAPGLIRYARSLDGSTWSTPQTVSSAPSGETVNPIMALDGGNNLHVVWSGDAADGWDVYYARRLADGPWSPPRRITLDNSNTDWRDAALAVAESGLAHIGWNDKNEGVSADVFYASTILSNQAGEATLSQTVAVPAADWNPGLSFLVHLGGVSSMGQNALDVAVQSGGTTTSLLSLKEVTPGWTHRWLDLKPWAGQNVTLLFTLHQTTGELQPWAFLDEVTVGSTYPELWIAVAAQGARPGEAVVYNITYGNRGSPAASATRVTMSLPAGLALVSADPSPSSIAPLTWNVGDLPGHSGPFSITVTTRADTPVGLGWVTNSASIATQSPELETHNNSAQATVFVGHLTYLPAIFRR